MAVLFDTLKLADRLEAAGMPPRQAHDTAAALAEALTDTLATSADVAAVRTDLEASAAAMRGEIREAELRLKTEIATVRTEIATVRTEVAELRGEMRSGDERLRGEIRDLHSRLVWWILGTGAGAAVTIIGAVAALLRMMR